LREIEKRPSESFDTPFVPELFSVKALRPAPALAATGFFYTSMINAALREVNIIFSQRVPAR
jgi:hypothetical protein